jgi:hypothetical protein
MEVVRGPTAVVAGLAYGTDMTLLTATRPSLQVSIRGLISQPYLGKRLHVRRADVGSAVRGGYAELFARLAAERVMPAGAPFLVASPPRPEGMDVELGVPCAAPPAAGDLYAGMLPGGRAAVVTYRGPYDGIAPTYEALARWLLANAYTTAAPPREVYLRGPEDVARPTEYVTEVVWPIG